MNNIKKIISFALALLLIFSGQMVYAKEETSTIIYGAALSEDERTSTKALFSDKNAKEDIITGEDYDRYLGDENTSDASLISSVQVTTGVKEGGISVSIVTPENITKITADQYVNAVLTSGLGDSNIEVAAIRPVTGESALAGIYKVAEVNGIKLDEKDMKLAEEELTILSDVSENNKEKDDFEDSKFQDAITNIKIEIANLVENKGGVENVSESDVRDIVINIFNELNININESDIDKIVDFMVKFKDNIDVNRINEFLGQAEKIVGGFIKDAKDSGFWDRIVEFFSDLWNSIVSLFSDLSNK